MGNNLVTWFEIPVKNFETAKKFYCEAFGCDLHEMEMDGKKFGIFPSDKEVTGGAIVAGEGYEPTSNGMKLFFEASENIDDILSRVESAGGKVTVPRTRINDEIGDIAFFSDPDGNAIGLHAHS